MIQGDDNISYKKKSDDNIVALFFKKVLKITME